MCGLDEHLQRQIDGKFGSQSSVIISPGGYLEAPVIIPWFITWSYPFNLESFLAQGSYYQISKKEVKSL